MKNTALHKYIGSFKLVALAAALLASVHLASADQVNIQLTGVSDPQLIVDGNYWNVMEFGGSGHLFISDALDINSDSTGIGIYALGEYEGGSGCVAETGGGSITFEIDLPSGTFDISPGFGSGSSEASITGDSFTGIEGPATIYLSFLNNNAAITTATSIVISQY